MKESKTLLYILLVIAAIAVIIFWYLWWSSEKVYTEELDQIRQEKEAAMDSAEVRLIRSEFWKNDAEKTKATSDSFELLFEKSANIDAIRIKHEPTLSNIRGADIPVIDSVIASQISADRSTW